MLMNIWDNRLFDVVSVRCLGASATAFFDSLLSNLRKLQKTAKP